MKHLVKISLFFCVFLSTLNAQIVEDTINVGAGWNMIGSLSTGPVSDILRSEPDTIIASAFFAYNPGGGYEAKDTLKKGEGYWVKANADGLIIFSGGSGEWTCGSPLEYSGKEYNTILIGSQCWLKGNLDVGTRINGNQSASDNGTIEKYCYLNDPVNCDVYGGLYQWNEAMQYTTTPGTRGICPSGWHIPTRGEYETLRATVGGDGNTLKASGQGSGAGIGTNTSGFSALLAGQSFYDGTFGNLSTHAYFLISLEYNSSYAWNISLDYGSSSFSLSYGVDKDAGYSVRCLMD
jgi:uncharacterized protein (TIGR02145 family)